MFPQRADCCVCVRLCASERKREREKESVLAKGVVIGEKKIHLSLLHSLTHKRTHTRCCHCEGCCQPIKFSPGADFCVCVCVRERARKPNRAKKMYEQRGEKKGLDDEGKKNV